ncbi:trypsin-like peptidase domain-containing protein [Sphaerisporangium sp. TRM90804]|uniref:S1C family serine protease n=1 Tax=Sphaerisporangium sp. TRM90804 TaxID=3031113 RepID=UPI00244CC0E7|nr:trypsin-like peptidase domain-containing protein [Sphaerisporangium sp. TRM90804]MDH2429586.1 trypsin-like peptidase domain-containing protein [Sphaerisporangium sp. TRM90804]
MNAEDPREQSTDVPAQEPDARGWTQFGRTPPEPGAYRPRAGDTQRLPAASGHGPEQGPATAWPDMTARSTAQPGAAPGPVGPAVNLPPPGHLGGTHPGAPRSGADQPGAGGPGAVQPGMNQVGAAPPGGYQPGAGQPGSGHGDTARFGAVPFGMGRPGPGGADQWSGVGQPGAAQPGRWGTGRKVAAGLALAAMALGGGAAGAVVATAASGNGTVITSPIVRPASDSAGTTVADVARAVQPSVVSITVTSGTGQGEGSGVILSEDGLILTNNHVVAGAGPDAKVQVKFTDGTSATASVVGTDPTTDLAVVRAQNVSGLTKATLGDSDKLKVGDAVLAIGSPLGLEGSVTAGIVSALDRTLTVGGPSQNQQRQLPPGWPGQAQPQQQGTATTIGGAIQTDAAINPGNSGGALVNASGQVVGVNSAIATNGGDGNIGVGFAIPINTARQVADQLIATGKATHAFLGVDLADATGDVSGAVIGSIQSGSPAEAAGLKAGDLITKLNDKPVAGADTVVGAIRALKPGTKITVTYVRGGQTATATVTLVERTTAN